MATKTTAAAKPIAGDKTAAQIKKEAAARNEAKREGLPKKEPVAKKVAATPSAPEPIKLSIKLDASKADVEKLIASIKTRGAKLDTDVHSAACASLNHCALHNDPVLLCRLVNAMPKSSRRNAVVLWALKHGNVMLNDGPSKDTLPLVYSRDKKADIDAAVKEPFWELKNVREGGQGFVYVDFIASVMKKLAREAGDPTNPEARKAKAALDAITAVNEAINTTSKEPAPQWVPGMEDRRAPRDEPAVEPPVMH